MNSSELTAKNKRLKKKYDQLAALLSELNVPVSIPLKKAVRKGQQKADA